MSWDGGTQQMYNPRSNCVRVSRYQSVIDAVKTHPLKHKLIKISILDQHGCRHNFSVSGPSYHKMHHSSLTGQRNVYFRRPLCRFLDTTLDTTDAYASDA